MACNGFDGTMGPCAPMSGDSDLEIKMARAVAHELQQRVQQRLQRMHHRGCQHGSDCRTQHNSTLPVNAEPPHPLPELPTPRLQVAFKQGSMIKPCAQQANKMFVLGRLARRGVHNEVIPASLRALSARWAKGRTSDSAIPSKSNHLPQVSSSASAVNLNHILTHTHTFRNTQKCSLIHTCSRSMLLGNRLMSPHKVGFAQWQAPLGCLSSVHVLFKAYMC